MRTFVGRALHLRFAKYGMRPTGGCACGRIQRDLDRSSLEEIWKDRREIADRILESARKGRRKDRVWAQLKTAISDACIVFLPTWLCRMFVMVNLRMALKDERKRIQRTGARRGVQM